METGSEVRGYLLDVNHVSAHFRREPSFMDRLRLVPVDAQWRVCSITLGEIEASHRMSTSTDPQRRNDYARFVIDEYAYNTVDIAATTRDCYASIIGRIWQIHPPPGMTTKTERHLIDCGVHVNDVWMVSAAWEHGLVVLTEDTMTCIRDAVPEVTFECWI
jgi:predicted nucleic acid-binding protein